VEPGEYVALDGWSWFPEIMNCELPVKLRIKDSGGDSHGMGSIQHKNDDFATEVQRLQDDPDQHPRRQRDDHRQAGHPPEGVRVWLPHGRLQAGAAAKREGAR
jgi:hypothetical protein